MILYERTVKIMDIMEKVEQLREKANISYEEAKAVLDETGGDILDAIILLEQRGKVRKPETEIMKYTGEEEKESGTEDGMAGAGAAGSAGRTATAENRKVKNTMKKIINVLRNNFFCVTRKDEELFKMPAWAFLLILFFFWEPVIPIMIIALFFDVRYSFTGKDDLESANRFMDKVGSMADEVSSEFKTV